MSTQFQDIQEGLFEYFKDIDDKMLVEFIDSFVYYNSTQNIKVSKLINQFLEDNELVITYTNFIYDRNNPYQNFTRCLMSERGVIQDIQTGLLSLAYNRLRGVINPPKPRLSPLIKLSRTEKDDLKVVIEDCERRNDDLVSDEDTTRSMFNEDEANELIDERKRFSKLFTKVLKMIK